MPTTTGMFDIDALIREADIAAAPAWTGAPLRYHEQYTTPEALEAAFDRWIFEHGRHGCMPISHMWHRSGHPAEAAAATAVDVDRSGAAAGVSHHELHMFFADTRCDGVIPRTRTHQHEPDELPGELMTQAICPGCEWHLIALRETRAVEAWHDHALPGWRNLPVVPETFRDHRGEKKALARLRTWVEENYPLDWQRPGYPILTERKPHGTRAVPGGSPWRGYDISAPA